MPSRLHRSLTVTSRRKPSSTIRIFSSGVYLRRVAALTVRDEGPGRLCTLISGHCFACFCLGHLWLLYLKYSTSSRELTPPQISRVFLPPLLSHYR